MSTGKTIALIKGLGNGGGSGLPTGGEPYKQLVTDENGEAVWSPIAGKNVTGTVYKISGSDVTAGKGAEIFNDYANNKATGQYSHAEGSYTIASGNTSHAEGQNTTASGNTSHAEGQSTTASGIASHAEGHSTTASGNHSHAEGQSTTASGIASHAEGIGTTATVDAQHAQGKWNKEDTEGKYAHIVGNGAYKDPSNAHTIDWNGNGWFAGDVFVGGTGQETGEKLAKESYIPEPIYIPETVASIQGAGQAPCYADAALTTLLTKTEAEKRMQRRGQLCYVSADGVFSLVTPMVYLSQGSDATAVIPYLDTEAGTMSPTLLQLTFENE